MPQIVQADTSAPSIEGLELTQGKTYEFEGAGKVGDEKTTPLGTIVQLLLLFRGTGGPKLARLAAGWARASWLGGTGGPKPTAELTTPSACTTEGTKLGKTGETVVKWR